MTKPINTHFYKPFMAKGEYALITETKAIKYITFEFDLIFCSWNLTQKASDDLGKIFTKYSGSGYVKPFSVFGYGKTYSCIKIRIDKYEAFKKELGKILDNPLSYEELISSHFRELLKKKPHKPFIFR